MNTIQPNDSDLETQDSARLKEGEEISLNIEPRKAEQPTTAEEEAVENIDNSNYQKITKMHHGKIDHQSGIAPHAQGELAEHSKKDEEINNKQLDVVVQKYPLVDLTPGSVHSEDGATAGKKSARQKLKELRSHKHWHNAKLVVATVLVFLLIFNSQWFISQFMYFFNKPKAQNTSQQSQNQTVQQETKKSEAEVVGPQNQIIIPKIGVTAPLVFINTTNEADVLVALRDGVVHYYGTAMPGENGNAAFFGHSSNDWWEAGSYKFVFVLLEKLAVGDTYEIHYNSRKYVYQVTQTKVVAPNDLSVLNQTSEPTSTLITCTPPGTSWQRFVVSAKQIAPAVEAPANPQVVQQNATQAGEKQVLPGAAPSLWQQITDFFSGLFGRNKKSSNQNQSTQQNTAQHLPEVN